jgi:hypothetical protein
MIIFLISVFLTVYYYYINWVSFIYEIRPNSRVIHRPNRAFIHLVAAKKGD